MFQGKQLSLKGQNISSLSIQFIYQQHQQQQQQTLSSNTNIFNAWSEQQPTEACCHGDH